MSGPLAYTTTIPASRTALEVVGMLASHGADAVGLTYTDKRPTGVTFLLTMGDGPRTFALPVNAAGTLLLLRRSKDRGVTARHRTPEQAERVAWRVVRQWLEAQLALVEANLATLGQVMLPYMQVEGRSLYAAYLDRSDRALEA